MAKHRKQIEYRYYEVPSNHYVIALMGDAWEMHYGTNAEGVLHFHNYLEIGLNYWGSGNLLVEENVIPYKGGITTIIPQNIPHSTVSDVDGICKWEYLFIDIENFIRQEMQFKRLLPEEVIKRIDKQSYVIHWNENKTLTTLIRNILDEYRDKRPYYKEAVNGYLRALVIELLRISEEMNSSMTMDEKRNNNYVEQSIQYIAKHYAEEIKMYDIASACGLSESHFRRIFEESMSMKPLDYVNMIRIDKACELIQNENYDMDEVSVRVGYETHSTFFRNFKKLTGKTPYQWKKEETHMDGATKNYKISAKKGW